MADSALAATGDSELDNALNTLGYSDDPQTALPKVSKLDPFDALGRGLGFQAGQLKQNYFNASLITRRDLSEQDELSVLQQATHDNHYGLEPQEIESQPWYVRAGIDAEGLGASLLNTYAAGFAGGGASAAASLPIAGVASRIPYVGPVAATAIEGGAFEAGFTTGSVAAMGTQAAGSMYGTLRLQGVSRDTAAGIASAFGAINGVAGLYGFNASRQLAGTASTLAARAGLTRVVSGGTQTVGKLAQANPAVRKVQQQLMTRLAVNYAGHVVANTAQGEADILLRHAAQAYAGYLEKHDWSAYTNWGDTQEEMKNNFLTLLAGSALTGAAVAGAGAAAGKVKTTIAPLTEESVGNAIKQIKQSDPVEILQSVTKALQEKPFPFEEENPGKVVITEDGRPVIQAGVTATDAEPSDPLAGTALGKLATQIQKEESPTPEDIGAVLDELQQPDDKAFAPNNVEGRTIGATDEPQVLTHEETRARINQIAADQRVLKTEQRKLESEFNRKDKVGQKTTAVLKKLETVLDAHEELQTERELLEGGLLSRDEVARTTGSQRMKTLAGIMKRLQTSNEKLAQVKEANKAKVVEVATTSRQTGRNVERKAVQTLQKQLGQFVKTALKDRGFGNDLRNELYAQIRGVTTPDQFKAAGDNILARLQQAEDDRAKQADLDARRSLIDKIDKLTNQGKVRMQSGHPVSKLDADTTRSLQLLKGFLVDQDQPVAKRQNLAAQAMDTFLNAATEDGETYADLMANGQTDRIPLRQLQDYQMAVIADDIQNKSHLELNVMHGNLLQMVEDSKNEIAAKHAALKAQREAERVLAQASTGADTHTRIEGRVSPAKSALQRFETTLAKGFVWENILEQISPKDPTHAIRDLLDTTETKDAYYKARRLQVGAARQYLTERMRDAGFDIDFQNYSRQASSEEYSLPYINGAGDKAVARHTRAEIIDIAMKLEDPTLHAAMKDVKKGNAWTFPGDVPAGQSFVESIYTAMRPEDVAMRDAMLKWYQDYHARINEPYRNKYGVDLPNQANYSPSAREGFQVDPGKVRQGMFSSLLPGSAKSRVNNLNKILPRNAFTILDDHTEGWEHFIAYDELLGTMRNVFSDPKMRTRIRDEHGSGTMQIIDDYIQRFIQDDPMPSKPSDWVWAALRGNMARAALPFRAPLQVLQQVSSGVAMWRDSNPANIAKGVVLALRHPVETEKAFRASPILRHRFEGGASMDLSIALNEVGLTAQVVSKLSGADATIGPEQYDLLMRMGFAGIKYGDAAAVRLFGAPLYWSERAQGKSPSEAMMTVERMAESTQQGDSVENIPDIYATNSALYTLFGQFTLQPMQLFNHTMIDVRDFFNRKPTAKSFASLGKRVLSTWLLPGLFFGMVQNAPGYFSPPNESAASRYETLYDVGTQAILGPVNGVPVIGQIMEAVWFAAAKDVFGVDKSYLAKAGTDSISQRIFENPKKAFEAWIKVVHADDDTKTSKFKLAEKDTDEDVYKAIFATGRAAGPLLGLPSAYLNTPASIANAMRHGDFTGAMFALSGWSPGQINRRYAGMDTEEKLLSPSTLIRKDEDADKPLIRSFVEGAIAPTEEEKADAESDLENLRYAFEQGVIDGTIGLDEPAEGGGN